MSIRSIHSLSEDTIADDVDDNRPCEGDLDAWGHKFSLWPYLERGTSIWRCCW